MRSEKPYGMEELCGLLRQAEAQRQPVWTRRQQREGLRLDLQNWNRIAEIDRVNLTATAERAVTLGELEDAAAEAGLHVAAMTEDLRTVQLGDFFAEQMFCLSSQRYKQPRFQVLGLEAVTVDGTLLKTGGKMMKNVTGYDMCRFYLSGRETMAVPLRFTLKLVSREASRVVLRAPAEERQLPDLVQMLRDARLTPWVCLFVGAACGAYDAPALWLGLTGSAERVARDRELLEARSAPLGIDWTQPEDADLLWRRVKELRGRTVWANGLKVPAGRCGTMLRALAEEKVGAWYHPLEGNLQLIPEQADGAVYQRLCGCAEALGGCGNWFYQYRYGFAPARQTELWREIKRRFDPQNRLNPMTEGGVPAQ